MASPDKSAYIFIALLCVGVVVASLFIMLMYINPRLFVYSVLTYILGYCIYMAVYVIGNRAALRERDDTRYNVCVYITLFNIFFMTCLFVVHVVFQVARSNVFGKGINYAASYNTSPPAYRRYY